MPTLIATPPIPLEADPERAPSLLEGARTLQLEAPTCGVEYWLQAVGQGTLRGLAHGRAREAETPPWMTAPGPLRQALVSELAFRSIAEDKATRAIAHLVAQAPDVVGLEFFTTQLLDEARHAAVFRHHLLDLGVPAEALADQVEAVAGADRDRVLAPLEAFGLEVGRDQGDYIGGVVVLTVLVEGVLAPAAELSERKWRVLDPVAAQVERLAGIDEIRHLSVGSDVVRRHVAAFPGERARLQALVARGQELWMTLPVLDLLVRREHLFQEGLAAHADVVGDTEIWPGRRLVDTTPDERLTTGLRWSSDMQAERLAYMGLA